MFTLTNVKKYRFCKIVFARLLNKGFRGSLVLLILMYLLSATLSYFSNEALEMYQYPDLIYNYITKGLQNKFLINSLNFLMIGIGILLVSIITSNQEITDKQNYFPVFVYALICIASVNPVQISPQLFTNLFILYSLYRLLDIYRKENSLNSIFEAAFWLCASAFVTVSSIICFPLFFIVLMILRPFYWREWAVAFLGFLSPVFLYECLAYLLGWNHWYLFDSMGMFMNYLEFPVFSEYYLPLSLLLLFLLTLSVINILMYGMGNTVKKQRSKTIFLWCLFIDLFGFFSGGANSSGILLIYAIPLCFFIGDFLFGIRQIKITNTLLSLMLLCLGLIVFGKLGLF